MVRTCSQCKEEKDDSFFYVVQQRGKPYVRPRCKACEIAKSTRWNRDNPDKAKGHCANWRESHRKEDAALARRWAVSNPERVRKTHREYYEKNLHAIRRKSCQWAKDNAHLVCERTKRRK